MSLLFGRRDQAPPAEARTGTFTPWWPRIGSDDSYAEVDTDSLTAPLQSVAVSATVDLLTSLCSELPVDVYSGHGSDRRKRPTPGYLEDPAGDGHGLEDWIAQALTSWLLRGNLFGDVLEQARGGYPTQISLQHPDTVTPTLDNGRVLWSVNGQQDTEGRIRHWRINPVPGVVLGLSPVGRCARQVKLSLTGTQFGLQWFRDGAHPAGLLTNTLSDIDKTQGDTAKARFIAALRGLREPLVLGRGWEWKTIQIAPEESQFLETQGWSEAQCARIFGPGLAEVLGYESGGSMTYANVESRSTHLLVYSVGKWIRRAERLLNLMLPRPQYARINRDAMLQSTTLARYQAHNLGLAGRWRTVNEVRELEDLRPVPWGDAPNDTGTSNTTPTTGADASLPEGGATDG